MSAEFPKMQLMEIILRDALVRCMVEEWRVSSLTHFRCNFFEFGGKTNMIFSHAFEYVSFIEILLL